MMRGSVPEQQAPMVPVCCVPQPSPLRLWACPSPASPRRYQCGVGNHNIWCPGDSCWGRGLWARHFPGGNSTLTCISVSRLAPGGKAGERNKILAHNLLNTPGETVLCKFWIITVTLEGVKSAFFMVVRIMMLITATFLLTYTTSPILLTDGIESLLSPLKLIRVPVHELARMMSMALRFIPTLIEETDKIMCAQRARGADFESGSLIRRAKALIPLLVPLFISAFRRADELAVAMECRCYHGGKGRTRLRQLRYHALDWVTIVLAILLCVAIGFLGRMGL